MLQHRWFFCMGVTGGASQPGLKSGHLILSKHTAPLSLTHTHTRTSLGFGLEKPKDLSGAEGRKAALGEPCRPGAAAPPQTWGLSTADFSSVFTHRPPQRREVDPLTCSSNGRGELGDSRVSVPLISACSLEIVEWLVVHMTVCPVSPLPFFGGRLPLVRPFTHTHTTGACHEFSQQRCAQCFMCISCSLSL